MNSRQRIFGCPPALAIVIAFVLLYGWKYAGPTRWILQARKAVRKDPTLANTPIPLADKSVSAAPGTTFTEFGFQFEVPWIAKEKSHEEYGVIIYVPDGGNALMFFNPAKETGLVESSRQMLKDRGQNPLAANLYLDAPSDYEFERSMWYATPDQLSLFFPRRKEIFAATRLITKDALKPQAKTGMYVFTFGQLRGFQFGDPARVHSVRVDAFDGQDRKFVFSIGTKSDSSTYLKQADINRVLQSLRPAPATPTTN